MATFEQIPTGVTAAIVQTGVLAADCWAMDNEPWWGTKAQYTRGLIETAVMHLIEQGLLVVPEDAGQRMQQPIPIQRQSL